MMGFRDLLRETYDSPYRVELRTVVPSPAYGPLGVYYRARLDRKNNVMDIEISRYSFGAGASPYYAWQVDFSVNGSYDLRGQGNPTRTLATVMEAIQKFLQWHKGEFDRLPDEFSFLSKSAEPGRERVYAAMVRRFAGGMGYRLKSVEGSGGSGAQNTVITVVRKT